MLRIIINVNLHKKKNIYEINKKPKQSFLEIRYYIIRINKTNKLFIVFKSVDQKSEQLIFHYLLVI